MGCSVAISSSAYRLGGALTSNVLFESWTSPVAFLNARLSAFIDAIPLYVLS